MQQLVSGLSRPTVLSDRALRQLSKLKDAHAELAREHGRPPTLAELADRTGLEPDQLANLIAAERLGLSPERVRQLENRALGKLRAAATGETSPA